MKLIFSSHPNLVQVEHNSSNETESSDVNSVTEETYDSKLISKCSFKKGDVIARLENYIEIQQPSYLTVQVGRSKHVYLNSDFNYLNHSCDPNIKIDVKQMSCIAVKDISPGDDLSFFYPSTEWDMDQPFECWCGSHDVRGFIKTLIYIFNHKLGQ